MSAEHKFHWVILATIHIEMKKAVNFKERSSFFSISSFPEPVKSNEKGWKDWRKKIVFKRSIKILRCQIGANLSFPEWYISYKTRDGNDVQNCGNFAKDRIINDNTALYLYRWLTWKRRSRKNGGKHVSKQ